MKGSRAAEDRRDRGRTGAALVRRPAVVLSVLVLLGALLAATTRPWVTVTLAAPVAGVSTFDVTGTQAAPVVTACALTGLAAAAALSIAGRLTRVVVLAVCALAAGGAGASAVAVGQDPVAASREQVAQALLLTPASVTADSSDVVLTAWVWLAVALSAGAAAVAVVGLVAGRSWDHSERFAPPAEVSGEDRPRSRAGPPHPAASWDALSSGVDPTFAAGVAEPVHRDIDRGGGRMVGPGHAD